MATSAAAVSSAIDAEYIGKLIKVVKETLAIVMRSANVAIDQNAEVDLGTKSAEGTNNRLEKSLEDFYNACDQLQLCLLSWLAPSGAKKKRRTRRRLALREEDWL
ncbi:mediator of RNA polymerase II transcription subunit 29-like [Oculina patagonica]